nr:hypothetical protein CFP56_09708 [Quercus suber]
MSGGAYCPKPSHSVGSLAGLGLPFQPKPNPPQSANILANMSPPLRSKPKTKFKKYFKAPKHDKPPSSDNFSGLDY